jgi:NhaP-type Na+/H+ or K+/H+ antiporter
MFSRGGWRYRIRRGAGIGYSLITLRISTAGYALANVLHISGPLAMAVSGVDCHTLLLMMTYVVVIFSIVVQGSTIGPMIERSAQAGKENRL